MSATTSWDKMKYNKIKGAFVLHYLEIGFQKPDFNL